MKVPIEARISESEYLAKFGGNGGEMGVKSPINKLPTLYQITFQTKPLALAAFIRA